MTELQSNRLVEGFAERRASGRKTLVPFLTAGHPNLEVTAALLKELDRQGLWVCELGVAFSDPIADGPIIQASYTAALGGGVTSEKIFDMVGRYRADGGKMALVAMVSYSIVFRHGVSEYLAAASDAGFDGLIVPDLPLEEAAEFEPLAASLGLANVMLVAPTTPQARRLEIARHSRGFIYYVSVSGITGERDKLPDETIAAVSEFRSHTDTPVCVGFGISNAATVGTVCEVADGAIVGSAIIHRITDAESLQQGQIVAKIGGFVGELLIPLK